MTPEHQAVVSLIWGLIRFPNPLIRCEGSGEKVNLPARGEGNVVFCPRFKECGYMFNSRDPSIAAQS